MKKKIENFPIIFTHLPRSGGTTLDSYMSKEYKNHEMFHFYVRKKAGNTSDAMAEFNALSQEQKKQLKLLVGHTSFGIHQHFDRFTYITLFREPIERLVSYYFHILKNNEHYLHNITMTNRLKLNDLVCNAISTEFDNDQTRQLAGVKNVPFGQCTQEMLDTAKHNLMEYYKIFGITERFDESVMLFKNFFGWNLPFYIRLNTTARKQSVQDIPAKILDEVRKINHLDIQLYHFAREKFQELIAKQDNSFHLQLKRFKSLNGRMQKSGKPGKESLLFLLWNTYLRLKKLKLY